MAECLDGAEQALVVARQKKGAMRGQKPADATKGKPATQVHEYISGRNRRGITRSERVDPFPRFGKQFRNEDCFAMFFYIQVEETSLNSGTSQKIRAGCASHTSIDNMFGL
jgi:hypothetical protein